MIFSFFLLIGLSEYLPFGCKMEILPQTLFHKGSFALAHVVSEIFTAVYITKAE